MPRRLPIKEECRQRTELTELYIEKNMTIKEIAPLLSISENGVFYRLRRLGIQTIPEKKVHYQNRRNDIRLPLHHSPDLAELFGILLGDGHISPYQTVVTLGDKEQSYVEYVSRLFAKVTSIKGTVTLRQKKYHDVYVGSVALSKWFFDNGLVSNKTRAQVGVPEWICSDPTYMRRFLRGFFDTDGSVYKLRFGIQLSFCNMSKPLLKSTRDMLVYFGYRVSRISGRNIYITKRTCVERFFEEIAPQNQKHQLRYERFKK